MKLSNLHCVCHLIKLKGLVLEDIIYMEKRQIIYKHLHLLNGKIQGRQFAIQSFSNINNYSF